MKVSVVIPVYNEAETILDIINKIQDLYPDFEIVVINDGSTDGTLSLLKSIEDIVVINNVENLGNGASVKKGIYKSSGDIIVMMDGDGQHAPEDIQKLLACFPEYDLVIGSRGNKKNLTFIRNLGNFILNSVATYLSGKKIYDLTSGFRAFKRKQVMKFLPLFPKKYSYPSTTTLSFLKFNYQVKFLFLDTIVKRTIGKSSISPIKDGLKFLVIIFRIILLFNPLKVFLPLSGIIFLIGFGFMIFQLISRGGIFGISIVTIISSFFILILGLVSSQISDLRKQILELYDRE